MHGEGTLEAGNGRLEACREWVTGWGVPVVAVACASWCKGGLCAGACGHAAQG